MLRRSIAVLTVASFLLLLAPSVAAGGGCMWQSAQPSEERTSEGEVTAFIAGCRFEPTTLYIQPGTTVTWSNKDPVPHSVTGAFLTLGSDRLINQGASTTVAFDEEGVFPYYCVLHPGMAASVVVGNPLDGVAGSDDAAAAPPASTDRGGPIGETSSSEWPLVAGAAALATATGAGIALLVRRRRRVVPVPGALP